MNRNTAFGILAVGLAVALVTPVARAADPSGGVPGEWLSRWSGARSVGMGSAWVAYAQEPAGVIWNPAGIARMDRNEVHFETARLFEQTQLNAVSFAMPNRRLPAFGLTVLSLGSGDFEKTNDLNEPVGSFSEGELAFLFSASKNIVPRLSVGTNVKVIRQSIDEFDASGWGFDLGVLFDVTRSIRVGASIQNLGGPGLTLRETTEKYPVETRGGFAASVLGGRGLVSAEVHHVPGPGFTIQGGSEYWVHPSMALRLGYDVDAPAGGFSYRVRPDMRLDYGMTTHDLGVTHRFGIKYSFGGFQARSEAKPEVFSPLGAQPVTKIELMAHTKAEAEKWQLAIESEDGEVVRRFGGAGAPPAHVMWDGKDEVGLPLPDGEYGYQLVVVDAEGRELAAHERIVRISTGGPRGSVPVLVN